jgi:hypothetical protein
MTLLQSDPSSFEINAYFAHRTQILKHLPFENSDHVMPLNIIIGLTGRKRTFSVLKRALNGRIGQYIHVYSWLGYSSPLIRRNG